MSERTLAISSHMKYGQMRWYAASLGVTVSSLPTGELDQGVMGVYDDEAKMILIDRGLTYVQKRCTLAHELVHWVYGDNACDPVFRAKEEHRARRQAAGMLISSVEYSMAEEMYDSNPLMIARELDVTVQVLRDYQKSVETIIFAH